MQVAQGAPLRPSMDIFAVGWAFSMLHRLLSWKDLLMPTKMLRSRNFFVGYANVNVLKNWINLSNWMGLKKLLEMISRTLICNKIGQDL